MEKKLYFMQRYLRCGEMPVFLVFYRTKARRRGHGIMLCNHRGLRRLQETQEEGFTDPSAYGRTLCRHTTNDGMEIVKAIVKLRYNFDMNTFSIPERLLR